MRESYFYQLALTKKLRQLFVIVFLLLAHIGIWAQDNNLLKAPNITSSLVQGSDGNYFSVTITPEEGTTGTVKYSIQYIGNGNVSDVTAETYTNAIDIKYPCTITAWVEEGSDKSPIATAYRFGISPNPIVLEYGESAPTFSATVVPEVAGVTIRSYDGTSFATSNESAPGLTITGVGKEQSAARLSMPSNEEMTFIAINDTIVYWLDVKPAAPVFSLDEGTYDGTKTLTLTSPYTTNSTIKYYIGEEPAENIYDEKTGIEISESNTITAWVEAANSEGNVFESEKVTKTYTIKQVATLEAENKTAPYQATPIEFSKSDVTIKPESVRETLEDKIQFAYYTTNPANADTAEPTPLESAPTDVGTYYVKISLEDNDYFTASPIVVTLTIEKADLEGATVNVDATQTYTYTGSAIEPNVTVTLAVGGEALDTETDYTVAYTNNTNAATSNDSTAPTVTVTGKGNYTGTATAKFDIVKADLSNVTIAPIDSIVFTGSPIEPALTVTFNELAVSDEDYEVAYSNNTEVGEATVTLTSKNRNFTENSTKTATFRIMAATSTITVTDTDQKVTYNRDAQVITGVTIEDGKGTAVVTYYTSEADRSKGSNALEIAPTDAGTYYVQVTQGDANYTSTPVDVTFTIEQAEITEVTLAPTSLTYTGEAQTVNVTVKAGELELQAEEYEVSGNSQTEVDTYTVTVSAKENGNFKGSATATFTISSAGMNVTAKSDTVRYDGKPHGITVSVTDDNGAALEGVTIRYGEEEDVYDLDVSPTLTDAGTKTVYYEVTKKGYATIEGSCDIVIDKAEGSVAFASDNVQKTYGDAAFTNEATNTGDGRLVYSSVNEGVAKVDSVSGVVIILSAGSTVIEARVKEAKNYQYEQETYAYSLEVAAKANSSLTVTITGTYSYNGEEQIPTITVKDDENTLNSETDYDISYGDTGNVNAGEVTVTVTGKGNYAGSTGTATFTITPAKATITAESMTVDYDKKAHAYDKSLIKVTATPEVDIEKDIVVLYYAEDPSQLQEKDENPVNIDTPSEPGTYYVRVALNNENYEADPVVTTLTIERKPIDAGLSFSQSSIDVMLNAEFETPTLSNPNKLDVTWESSKTDVATVDQNGNVTIKGVGSTTISATFAGNDDYLEQTASYTISVSKQDSQKYDIWVGGTQVTSDNQDDIFGTGDAEEKVASSFSYNPMNNTLIVGGYESDQTIEVKNPEGLTLYLGPNTHNRLGKIVYTGDGDAPLLISTDGNNQGYLDLDATTTGGYVIEGFSVLNIDYIAIIQPEGIAYQNKQLATQTASIGQVIQPLTEETTVTPNDEDFKETNEEGETVDVDLTNTAIEDILYTLNDTNNPEGDGYDDTEQCIVINSITTNEEATKIVEEEKVPGTQEYAESFNGLTFMVPSGEGVIKIDVQTLNGYVMMVKIGSNEPISVTEEDRDVVEIPYTVEDPTFVYIYNAGKNGNGGAARSTIWRGKKTVAHVKVFSVSITPSKVTPSNSVKEVSGGTYTGDVSRLPGQGMMESPDDPISTAISEMTDTNVNKNTDKWYNLNGQQVSGPKQKGLYIHNGKKVYVK